MSKKLKLGYLAAFLTMLFWSIQMVIGRYAGTTLGASPFVFATSVLFIGSFVLVMIGGQGSKAIDSVRSGHTWLYSVFQLALNMGTLVSMLYVTSTQSMFLQKINILLALFIGWAFYDNRKISKHDLLGASFVTTGVLLMFSTIPKENLVMAVLSILFIAFCHVMRTNIAERHEIAKGARDFQEHCRIVGYVLLSTSLVFLLLGIIISVLKSFGNPIPFDLIPDKEHFITAHQLVLITFVGLCIVPVAMFSYFYASRALKSENMIIITGYLPLFTFIVESIAVYLGYVKMRNLILEDLISAVLIIGGTTYMTLYRTKFNQRQRKLAPKAKAELQVLRDSIHSTMMCFNDDEELVAKKLGVGKRTVKGIMTSEKPVTKNIRHKIILNYTQNVSGLDHLTGALNKSSFTAKLNGLNSKDKALVMFIDLNKFKPINDQYGHKAGDSLLEGIAQRLMSEFDGVKDVVARYGGDEFCLIIHNTNKKDEKALIKKVKKLISEPFIVPSINKEVAVGCSIGSAHYPTDGDHGQTLKEIADERMYQDKKANGDSR